MAEKRTAKGSTRPVARQRRRTEHERRDRRHQPAQSAAQEVCARMLAIAWERRAEYVFHPEPLAQWVARARSLGAAGQNGMTLVDLAANFDIAVGKLHLGRAGIFRQGRTVFAKEK